MLWRSGVTGRVLDLRSTGRGFKSYSGQKLVRDISLTSACNIGGSADCCHWYISHELGCGGVCNSDFCLQIYSCVAWRKNVWKSVGTWQVVHCNCIGWHFFHSCWSGFFYEPLCNVFECILNLESPWKVVITDLMFSAFSALCGPGAIPPYPFYSNF